MAIACSSNPMQQGADRAAGIDANEAYYQSIKHHTGLSFLAQLQKADSAQVVVYDDPDGDPRRYTRFYKWYNTSDSSEVSNLLQLANHHFERVEQVKDCRSQGKVFFFKKGQPLQTLYFSSRGDSCSHTYFIADGWFFYMPADSNANSFISSLQPRLAVPPAE